MNIGTIPKRIIIAITIIALSLTTGFWFYPEMPIKMAAHWDARGEVDGYMSRDWGLFIGPVVSAVMLLLMILLPRLDPLSANIRKFKRYYQEFIVILIGFLFYVHLLSIFWNLGLKFNMIQVLAPALSIVFYYAGILTSKAKRNWFIGIRTPWTLSSENVWDKVHERGGWLFKIVALVILAGLVWPWLAVWIVLWPVIGVAVYSVIYSYWLYRVETKKGSKQDF